MDSIMYQRSKKTWVTGIVFICVLCWGGFFDFAAIAMGAVFEILLLTPAEGTAAAERMGFICGPHFQYQRVSGYDNGF